MIVFAIDTCCGPFAITIKDDKKILSQIIEPQENKQAERLVVAIEKALKNANITYKDINLLVVTNGPGSFTGIRAGLIVVYAIAIVENIPCIGITTLEVIAYQLINKIVDQQFYVTVAAGRYRYYCQLFDKNLYPRTKIMLMEQNDIEMLREPVYGDYRERHLIDTAVLADLGLLRRSSYISTGLPKAVYGITKY